MLLETQDVVPGTAMLGPSEIVEAVWESIRLATALGVIVVEAGGNGTNNGQAPAVEPRHPHQRLRPARAFPQPGQPRLPRLGRDHRRRRAPRRRRTPASPSPPSAQRIDCYAWGQNIRTCSSDAAGATNLYTGTFGGTSAPRRWSPALPLCVQGIRQAATGQRLSPRQMRAILSDPAVNTPRAPTEATAIGVMPNLRGIVDNVLGLVPDVYIRDNVGDTGAPHNGAISASPTSSC